MRLNMVCRSVFLAIPLWTASFDVLSSEIIDEQEDGYIVITATRTERAIDSVAPTVTHISHEQLEEQLADTFEDTVRYEPGLSMATATRGGNTGLNIRGLGGNRVLMLMDGVRATDVYFAGPAAYGNDLFELDALESIQVIRGPASALYGSDAIGGVVLLDTKEADDYNGSDKGWVGNLNLLGNSSNDSHKLSTTLARSNDNGGLLLQLSQRNYSERDVAGAGQQTPHDGRSNNVMLKWNYHPTDDGELVLTFDTYQDKIDYLLSDSAILPEYGHDDGERQRLVLDYQLYTESAFTDFWTFRAFLQDANALQHTNQLRSTSYSFPSAPFGTDNPTQRITDFEFNQQVYGVMVQAEKMVSFDNTELTMIYGVEYEEIDTERPRNRCETDTVTGQQTCAIVSFPMAPPEEFPNKTFPDTRTQKLSVFWQGEFNFAQSNWSIFPGVRFDDIKMNADNEGLQTVVDFGYPISSTRFNELSPNLGGIYRFNEQMQLSIQYSEGFRAPNYDEANQSFVNLAHGYAIVPNPDLKPEHSQGLEVSLRSHFDDYRFQLVGYKNKFTDFIGSQFIGVENGIMLFQDTNIENVTIGGVEFRGDYQINDNWSFNHALAFAEGENSDTGEYLNSIEPLTLITGLDYRDETLMLGLRLITVDGKEKVASANDVTSGGYTVADIFGNVELTENALLRFGVFNLGNQKYARWANIKGLPANSPTLNNQYEPGRYFRLGLTYQF